AKGGPRPDAGSAERRGGPEARRPGRPWGPEPPTGRGPQGPRRRGFFRRRFDKVSSRRAQAGHRGEETHLLREARGYLPRAGARTLSRGETGGRSARSGARQTVAAGTAEDQGAA